MPDQPLPTLEQIASFHAREAADCRHNLAAAQRAGLPSSSRLMEDKIAWHEAAARQLLALAGEVERLRKASRDVLEALQRAEDRYRREQQDAVLLSSLHGVSVPAGVLRGLRAALAAPPAEERRERAGEES